MARNQSTDEGISPELMAESAHRVMQYAYGEATPLLGFWDADDEVRAAFIDVANRALEVLDDAENLPWVSFAAELYAAWLRRLREHGEYSKLPVVQRAAWLAVAKHLANLAAIESAEDLEDHERRWIGAANNLGKPVGA